MITVKKLEKHGFYVHKEKDGYEIQQYTPAGEDWCLFFRKLEEIKNYAENFDPEKEFTMWFNAKQSGIRGVPSIPELWKDQLWKQELLQEIAND